MISSHIMRLNVVTVPFTRALQHPSYPSGIFPPSPELGWDTAELKAAWDTWVEERQPWHGSSPRIIAKAPKAVVLSPTQAAKELTVSEDSSSSKPSSQFSHVHGCSKRRAISKCWKQESSLKMPEEEDAANSLCLTAEDGLLPCNLVS